MIYYAIVFILRKMDVSEDKFVDPNDDTFTLNKFSE